MGRVVRWAVTVTTPVLLLGGADAIQEFLAPPAITPPVAQTRIFATKADRAPLARETDVTVWPPCRK